MNTSVPVIITNFKTYETASAEKAVRLARLHESVAEKTKTTFIVAVQALDLAAVAEAVDIPVFAQHVDPVDYGSNTGWIVPKAVKDLGASGTLLNHSEHRLEWDVLKETVEQVKAIGLITAVCAQTPDEARRIAEELQPDYVCVEPPELIGGDISVSVADPGIIRDSVEQVGGEKLLVGAGVKNQEDVRIAREMGASGILLASGITKAEDPAAVLEDLALGLKAESTA